ncbi:MAG: hypothetical protein SOU05_05375 [Atopobium sp.]|nr:hypothetical protein [Atopobium sp.]
MVLTCSKRMNLVLFMLTLLGFLLPFGILSMGQTFNLFDATDLTAAVIAIIWIPIIIFLMWFNLFCSGRAVEIHRDGSVKVFAPSGNGHPTINLTYTVKDIQKVSVKKVPFLNVYLISITATNPTYYIDAREDKDTRVLKCATRGVLVSKCMMESFTDWMYDFNISVLKNFN